MVDLQSSIGLRQRIAQMIDADRGRIDKPGKTKPKIFMVSQADAERMLPKNARRISFVRPEQRGIELPKLTTNQKQIAALMAKLQARPDITASGLQQALRHLLKTSPRTSL